MTDSMTMPGAPPDSLPPGTPLLQGQFLIESFLNAGGFGITYLARNSLERRVVLKECYPSSICCRSQSVVHARTRTDKTEFDLVVRLFGEEARRLAKLDHPNIVGVQDVFEECGTGYMVLDYVEGNDLLDIIELEPSRLGPPEIRQITRKLLDAIGHVHRLGILHRDISPDNILLDSKGEPILIDFGAARDRARRASRVLSALQVVKDGYSPQEFYLAGSQQGPSGDLYSLGATLHHMLTGELPIFTTFRLAALAEQKPDPYVPLVGRVPGFDKHFLGAIDKALNVFAKDRLQSAEEWLEMIDDTVRHRKLSAKVSDDPEVARRIRELVADTNAIVKVEQERAETQRAEQARREEAERLEREAARARAREEALREARESAEAALAAARNDSATVARDGDGNSLVRDNPERRPGWVRRTFSGLRRVASTRRVGQMEGY
ncbi:serine/threonine protein kinase [Aliiruegeria haliotis]|uniref:Serine/threonine protein kinase n=1 Tax=Aliiruegeria haliotis TaxID=1280846 RepID=A0A2T0RYZ9_9RHOB|nr:serine/threonine-protein kinase [Aliiruegeria haliotis]PRY26416.1 serine/threonine protein kinase [Aliiruegeria haliotis]